MFDADAREMQLASEKLDISERTLPVHTTHNTYTAVHTYISETFDISERTLPVHTTHSTYTAVHTYIAEKLHISERQLPVHDNTYTAVNTCIAEILTSASARCLCMTTHVAVIYMVVMLVYIRSIC